MVELLVTHGHDSTKRIEKGLSEHGITCVKHSLYDSIHTQDLKVPGDVGLVYPSRLMEGGVADETSDLEWINGLDEVMKTRNKARTLYHLHQRDVSVPRFLYISRKVDRTELMNIDELIDFPVVVKPNSSTKGEGLVKVEDKDSFIGVMDYLDIIQNSKTVFDKSVLVQEFIPECKDFRVMVIDGEYVGCVERYSEGWKHNVHTGADVRKVNPPDDVIETSVGVANTLGVDFCGVDVLYNGDVFVNEVNSRPTVDRREFYLDSFYEILANLILETYNG